MRGIKYGFSFFCKNIYSNLFIALEIALLIITANSLLGFYNNIAFLYTPFEDILSNEGVYFFPYDEGPEGEELDVASITSQLKGEVRVYASYTGGLPGTTNMVHFVDDSIYDKFTFALSSGSFKEGCAVASYGSGAKVGDYVKTETGEIRVSGVLTKNSYYPKILYFQDVDEMYIPIQSGVDEEEFFIMSKTSAEKLYGEMSVNHSDGTLLISYKGCSNDDIEYNNTLLKNFGEVHDLETVNNRSVDALKDQYERFIPFIYIISIAVIIGIISFCIVTSLDNKADMDILYNCGAGSGSLFFVMLGKNLCIVISSVLFAAIALLGMKFTGVFANNGIRLMDNLLPLSALIICACIVMCQLVSTLSNLTFWRKVK